LNSARLRFSEAQTAAVLAWAKALSAQDVPSLYAIKKSQETLRRLVGDPTHQVTGANGNIFYINNIAHAIAKVNT
jgi:hypothetical protein